MTDGGRNQSGFDARAGDRATPRFVTVLFVDGVNSTGLLDDDLDKTLAELDQMEALVRAAIHQFGGMIARAQGDGFLAIFGAPAPLENHALHACCAALRIRDAFRALAKAASSNTGLRQVRIGLHTGTLVTRHRQNDVGEDYDVVGRDAHVAGKVQGSAPGNTVHISAVTLDLAGPAVSAQPRGVLKIPPAPDVPIYEIDSVNLHLDVDRVIERGHVSPFVGRADELARLVSCLDAARLDKGCAAGIVGGAGMGKSRLLYELFKIARARGFRVAELRGLSVQKHTPFGALKSLVMGLLDLRRDKQEEIDAALKEAGLADRPRHAVLEFSGYAPADEEWKGLNPQLRRQALFDGMLALVHHATLYQSCLVIIEDAQHLDSETLDIVDRLMPLCARRPLAVVVTGRSEARAIIDRLAQDPIVLAPLPREAARELCNILAIGTEIAPAAVESVVSAAAGVPTILQEMMRELQKGGAAANASPIGVTNFVHARMGALNRDARDVLDAASILAENIERSLLARTAGLDDEAMARALAELDRQDLVDTTSPTAVSFRCEIYRDAVVRSVLAPRRSELHASAARAYEATGRKDPNTFERLAHHSEQAGDVAGALRNILEAEKLAARSWSLKTVRALYGWAARLPVAPETEGLLAAVARQSFDALQQLGDADYRKALDFVVDHASRTGDLESEALAHGHLALLEWMRANLENAKYHGELAMAQATKLGNPSLLSLVQPHLANIEHARGDARRAIELNLGVVDDLVARGLERECFGRMIMPSVRSRSFAAWLLADCGRFDEAQAQIDAGGTALEGVDDQPYTRVLLNGARGILAIRRAQPQDAIAPLEEAHKLCLALYFYVMEAAIAGWLATALTLVGRAEEGRRIAAESIDSGRYRSAGRYSWVYVHQGLAEAQFACGLTAEALETIERAIAIAEESREPIHIAQAIFARGLMRLALGDLDAATKDVNAALTTAEQCGLKPLAESCRKALAQLDQKR